MIPCDDDPAIRCVVLTGAGAMFCGGGDRAALAAAGEQVPALPSELAGTLQMAVTCRMRMPSRCRFAHFTAACCGIGLTPDGGMSWLLSPLIGMRKAQDMIIANRRVGAEEGQQIGLVTRVVDNAALAVKGRAAGRPAGGDGDRRRARPAAGKLWRIA